MKHFVIPDCQVKPDVPLDYLEWVGRYIVDQKPDVIVQIGDFADLPSLSSYDVGKKSFEGRRYIKDIKVVHEAMEKLLSPIKEFNFRARKNKEKQYRPRMVLTHGNHENRITRVIESDPKLDGTLDISDLQYASFGWEEVEFLKPIIIDGIAYCHYFTSGVLGRPVSSARNLVIKKHMSCVQGHVQHWEMHREVRADEYPIIGLFVGSCYLHNEDYLGRQGNNYWRGVWVLNEVKEGDFQPMPVSLNFLRDKYG